MAVITRTQTTTATPSKPITMKATVLNTPPPAPVPTHPLVYAVAAILIAALGNVVRSEFLEPTFLNKNTNHWFTEVWFPLTLLLLSLPHLMFMYIWWAPNRFTEIAQKNAFGRLVSGGRACDLMHFFVVTLKVIQFSAVSLWRLHANGVDILGLRPTDALHVLDTTTPLRVAVGLSWLGLGQVLNFGVYNAIGKDGVNYGFKLGAPGPWVTSFPYNLGIRHAQYTGCIMSIIGFYTIFTTGETLFASVAQCTVWCLYYIYSGKMEASSDADTKEDKVFDPKMDKKGTLTVKGGVKKLD